MIKVRYGNDFVRRANSGISAGRVLVAFFSLAYIFGGLMESVG